MDSLDRLVDLALAEDIGPHDITTERIIERDATGEGVILAKEHIVVAGFEAAARVFARVDGRCDFQAVVEEGQEAVDGAKIAEVTGPMRALLAGERTALNFLQRLSGIATLTRQYADAVAGMKTRILDTRKTTPGWRVLEKEAVRVGGGGNHRWGLYDGILIKDNHISACGGIAEAIRRARVEGHPFLKVEVEADDLDGVRKALEAGADIIMLDNMDLDEIREAVQMVNGNAVLEASGRIRLEDLASVAATGVDCISVGALTHSAPSVDISMEIA